MFDRALAREILTQKREAARRIERRFSSIRTADDFLNTDEGLDRFDAICMMLIAIGESMKNLDKVTDEKLLTQYPQVDWKGVKGVRDVISHQYFDIDAGAVYAICRNHIPVLVITLNTMIDDLK